MDDGRLPGEMTLDGIAKRLDAIDAKLGGHDAKFDAIDAKLDAIDARLGGHDAKFDAIDARLGGHDAKFDGLEAEMRSGFTRIDEKLNEAKIRDEELHGLLKFSLEAREGLRESMEQRFDVIGNKHDQEIGLLKDVLRHVTGARASG